jgi:transposase-like protein
MDCGRVGADRRESFVEGANISGVARRHEAVRGLLTVWRRQVSKAVGVKVRAGTDRLIYAHPKASYAARTQHNAKAGPS